MGAELAGAALERGHQVIVVSGPVEVTYPPAAEVVWITSTEELLDACRRWFPDCHGLIGAAAPCDYRPVRVESQKISKTGGPLMLQLVETPDVVATLAAEKRPDQWIVGFALETADHHFRAITKLERKRCDLIVLNGPEAMNAQDNRVEVIDREQGVLATLEGSKAHVARGILALLDQRFGAAERV